MKGGVAILIVLLSSLVVLVLYMAVGKSQLDNTIRSLESESDQLETQIQLIRSKELELPLLKAKLPEWRTKLLVYRNAIPQEPDEHIFFSVLNRELENNQVQLMQLNTDRGGSWLGQYTEELEAELTELKINAVAASSVQVLFFQLILNGSFEDIMTVFENLKRNERLYTIDIATGPSSAGSGMVLEVVNPDFTPIQFSGRLYFGMAESEVSLDTLNKVYARVVFGQASDDICNGIGKTAHSLVDVDNNAVDTSDSMPVGKRRAG